MIVRKLAFVDCLSVGGGLSRYSIALCLILSKHCKYLEIDFYTHEDNLNKLEELFGKDRINVIVLASTRKRSWLMTKLYFRADKFLNRDKYFRLFKELRAIVDNKYQVAFFPTAYMMKRPSLKIPMVGAFHDFNWKYLFGMPIFNKTFIDNIDSENKSWLLESYNICVSNFILNELKKFHGGGAEKIVQIPLGNPLLDVGIDDDVEKVFLKSMDINFPYLIFPGNYYPHKNHINLFAAFSLLVQRPGFNNIKLILTGGGTEHFKFAKAMSHGAVVSNQKDFNILGLGYVGNDFVNILIKNALLLVSPSLYEAQCMPGMDAWMLGTPTAISDIEPFRENEIIYSIKSAFFNPLDPIDIADTIDSCLRNYEETKRNADYSQIKFSEYSTVDVVEKYMDVFRKASISC
jgi:glycosyltransferase involved in cell wall biosynthesis